MRSGQYFLNFLMVFAETTEYFCLFFLSDNGISLICLFVSEFFKLMSEVENEDLVFTLETIVDKFGEEMAPYALGLCQSLVCYPSSKCMVMCCYLR
jgi:hypothetical protein